MCFDVVPSTYEEIIAEGSPRSPEQYPRCLIGGEIAEGSPQSPEPFLSDVSPSDKPWDTHKAQAVQVAEILSQGYSVHQKQSQRMQVCAQSLEFGWVLEDVETGLVRLKLKSTRFCRVRHCPICQWRRALMWVARFYHAFPKIYANHPEWRYIMITLTVRNCRVLDLRRTIKTMSEAWKRLTERKVWPAVGFVRSLEVTRGKDGSAHPHFHCLLAVKPSYFGKNYLSTAKWAELWREALRVAYTPICDTRIVKPKPWTEWRLKSSLGEREVHMDEVRSAILFPDRYDLSGGKSHSAYEPLIPSKAEIVLSAITEVIKYAVKPDDMIRDPAWLLELSSQLRDSKAVALGGELRKYLSEKEPEGLITESVEELAGNDGGIHFGWRERLKRYQKEGALKRGE